MRSKKAIGQNGTSHSGGVSQVGSRSCRAMPRKPPGLRRAILAGCDAVLQPVRPIRIVETVQQFVSPTRIAARV